MLAIVNARIRTGDARRPWADAVLVRDDKIEMLGSSAEIRKRAGTTATIIDATRMTVIPVDPGATDFAEAAGRAIPNAGHMGTVLVGMPARLLIIDWDPSRAGAIDAPDAEVVVAIDSGRVIYAREGFAP